MPRFRVSFEVEIEPESFEGMSDEEAAHLTFLQLDDGEMDMNDLWNLSSHDTDNFTVEAL